MNLITFLLKASWKTVAIAVFAGALSGICNASLIALINYTISRPDPYSNEVLWGFIGLAIGALLAGIVSQFLLVKLSQSAVYKLRLRLSRWILACPLRHLEELGASRLLATLIDDVEAISATVFTIPFLCVDIALILGCFVYLGWLSWLVFLVTTLLLSVAIFIVQILLTKARRILKLAREQQDHLFKHLRAITDGIKELKLHADRREAFFTEDLQPTAALSRDYKTTSMGIATIASNIGLLMLFSILGLLVFGLPKLTDISPSVLSSYVLTITFLTRPLGDLLRVLPELNRASVALRKIDALRLSLYSHSESTVVKSLPQQPQFQSIELVQATHSYQREQEESRFTLGPIDLTIYPGELIFIVGGNGSGKSTLAKLITGLYLPETGKILLDGQPVTAENREAYRQLFSTVFSDFYLFERLLGIQTNQLDEQARSYLEQLQLAHKVKVNEGVLSTIDLSQGQRKRLALLTAYLEDRPIYLFDEWASDQDPLFREIFYKQLLKDLKHRGKAVLVISHDDRYFHLADRLLKLDYGRLV